MMSAHPDYLRVLKAVELSLPSLPAGDLTKLASINRHCREAATQEYHRRLAAPFTPNAQVKVPVTVNRVEEVLSGESSCIPLCHRSDNPGCPSPPPPLTLEVVDGGWLLTLTSITKQSFFLQPPQAILPKNTSIIYSGLKDRVFSMALVQKSIDQDFDGNRADDATCYDEYYSDDEDTRKQIWGIVYKIITTSSSNSGRTEGGAIVIRPFQTQALTEARDPENSMNGYHVHFGETTQAKQGEMVAMVTQLQQGGDVLLLSIYDVTAHQGFVRRHRLSIPFHNGEYSSLDLAFSTGGEFLSILCGEESECGCWYVHDLQTTESTLIMHRECCFEFGMVGQTFTPDNELVLYSQDSPELDKYIQEGLFLPPFAKRIVLYTNTPADE